MRNYHKTDRWIIQFDQAMRTLLVPSTQSSRGFPDQDKPYAELSESERKLSGRLMRVNHAGEIAAQGLYHGQSMTAKDKAIKTQMAKSAEEEHEHLAWCQQRLNELDTHRSAISPLWYIGSFMIGAGAGLAGDRWSLGFVVETERQVEAHLTDHLKKLPESDSRSHAVLSQMREDEMAHADNAANLGAAELPKAIKIAMRAVSKIMTKGAYWV